MNAIDKEQVRQCQSLEDTWKDLEQHRHNLGIHFNQGQAEEADKRRSDRMDRMQADILEIKATVKEIAKKQ